MVTRCSFRWLLSSFFPVPNLRGRGDPNLKKWVRNLGPLTICIVSEIFYFRFWGPYRYFRLLIDTHLALLFSASIDNRLLNHWFVVRILTALLWTFIVRYKYFRFRSPLQIVGHYWKRLYTLSACLPWSNAVGLPLECWCYVVVSDSYFR